MQQRAQSDRQPVVTCKSSWITHPEEPIHIFPRTIASCNMPPVGNRVLMAEPRMSSGKVNRDNFIAMIERCALGAHPIHELMISGYRMFLVIVFTFPKHRGACESSLM